MKNYKFPILLVLLIISFFISASQYKIRNNLHIVDSIAYFDSSVVLDSTENIRIVWDPADSNLIIGLQSGRPILIIGATDSLLLFKEITDTTVEIVLVAHDDTSRLAKIIIQESGDLYLSVAKGSVIADTIIVNTQLIPDATGGADLGASGTIWNLFYTDSANINQITINTDAKPDADNGADLGTEGTEFDSLFINNIFLTNDFLGNSNFRGSDAFSGTAAADTIVNANFASTDYFFLSITGSGAPTSEDILSAEAKTDTLIVHRAGGTSGLTYNWWRIK
jgi:hypothetical protein